MTDTSRTRVHYFERQFLGTQDFEAEQQYHLAMRRRHNIAQHRWGIVVGLELSRDDDGLWVQPGMAIDGYGRELILTDRQQLATSEFDAKGSDTLSEFDVKGSDTLDVWIEYELLSSDPRSQRFRGCDTDDGQSFYRWQEQPRIRLTKPDPNFTNRREPGTVPDGDRDFAPFRAPPDDPQQDWPVFLGQINREQQRPNQPYTYSFSLADRPYVGLVGAEIVAPSGLARVQLGGTTPDEQPQFAVFVGTPQQANQSDLMPAGVTNETLALEISSAGAIHIAGATTVEGNLTMDGGAIEFRAGGADKTLHPWQMYYVIDEVADASQPAPAPAQPTDVGRAQSVAEQPKNESPREVQNELRIELPAGTAGANSFVIGSWSAEDKQFKPHLSVADSGKITVNGDLIVNGNLNETRKRPDAELSQRAQDMILASTISATGTAIAVSTTARPPSESDLDVLKRVLTSDAGRLLVAQTLAGNPDQLNMFVDRLLVQAADTVLKRVLADERARATIVKLLHDDEKTREAFVAALLADERARATIVKLLHDDQKAREAFVAALLADERARATIVKLLHDDEKTREAFVAALLADERARATIVKLLHDDQKAREAFVAALLADERVRATIVKLLHDDQAIRRLFVTALLADAACRDTVIELLLEDPQAFVDSILKLTNALLDKFIDRLLADTTGKRDVIVRRVNSNATSRQVAAETLASTQAGRQSIAGALPTQLTTDSQIKKFAEQLKQNREFADKLRSALEPGT